MPTVSQPKNLGDLLKYEAPNLYSRDQDTVAAAQNLPLGTVVGRETATAKLKALDPSASDGTETAVGVLGNDVDATLIDREDAINGRCRVVIGAADLAGGDGGSR